MTGLMSVFLQENVARLIVTIFIFIFALFIIGTGFTAVKLAMVRDLTSNKQLSLRQGWITSKKYFWKIVGIRVLVFLIFLVAILASMIVFGILNPLIKTAAIPIAMIIAVLLFLVISLSLFFRLPILYKKNLSPSQVLAASYRFFKANKRFTILVVFGVSFTMFIANQAVNMILTLLRLPSPILVVATGLAGIWIGMLTLIYTFFTFEKYKARS